MVQKQVSKKSGPVVRKKVSIKKPAVEQIIQPKLSDDEKSTELQNLMELIDIKGIIRAPNESSRVESQVKNP